MPWNRILSPSLLPALLLPSLVWAQSPPEVAWHGEVRPRFEAREPVSGDWSEVISMRARVALEARMDPGLRLFIQVQDVRNWGEEASERDRSADAVDFHQAFLEVDRLPLLGGMARVGRQEVALAESRFMGAPDWGQAGQTFDGAHWIRPWGFSRMEVVYLKLKELSAAAHDTEADFMGVWYNVPLGEPGTVDLLVIQNRESGEDRTWQQTVGGLWRAERGNLSFRAQGAAQLGERNREDVRAYMLALRGTVRVLEGKGSVTLWYDLLSGDDDPGDDRMEVFSTLYGARNRYYGRADYFTNIPEDTGGLGLQDAVLKLSYAPTEALSLNLDLHAFRTAAPSPAGDRRMGEEADAWVRYRYGAYLTVQGGYSLTRAGPVMEELGLLEGTGNYGYLMTSLKF